MCRKVRFFVVCVLVGSLFLVPANVSVVSVKAQREAAAGKYAVPLREFENFVRRRMKSDKTVGLTVGFIKDNFVWVKGFGYADLENKIPMRAESAYRLASVQKPMTALAVLQLAEQGKLNLDDEVQKYVPYFPRKKFPVTIRQLLGHLGGVTAYKTLAEERIKEHKNTREAIEIFAGYDLIAEPATRFSYSSYGYNLLGAVIEAASEKTYGEYLRENVWQPLGMSDTRMDDPREIIPHRVRGYQLIKGQLMNSEFVDISSRFAAGGTRSTVPDLLKFARGMIDGKLLSPALRQQMWTPMTTRNGRFTAYGMGWWTDSTNGHFVVTHGGSQNETQTALIVLPRRNFAIAVAMNFENATPYPYTEKLFELIFDEPWSIDVYAKNEKDKILLKGMDAAFDYGMRYFEQYDNPLTSDPRELGEAFAYFRDISKLPAADAAARVSNGRHPEANQAFVKMASYMAAKLRASKGTRFDEYYRTGAIALFADYVDWYKRTSNHPAELRFDETFEKQVTAWDADWTRSWNDSVRRLEISEASDLKQLTALLRNSFKGASVYPNFASDFKQIGGTYNARDDFKKAIEAVEPALEFYPDSADLNLELAISYILAGNKEKALAQLKKVNEIEPRYTSADTINILAYELLANGQTEAGVRLLEIGVEMHPRDANLYDSMGDFYVQMGRREKAVEFYRKALATDPNYQNAANARELLKKLEQNQPAN
jgi:CubicO group peptidase (beta-lactamase class C family)/Flp pilus assembly protein TadD